MSFYKAYSDAAIDTQSFVANPSMSPNELLTKDFVVRNRAAWAAMLENKGLDPEKENLAYLGSSDISAQHFTKFLKYRTDLAKARLLFCLGAGFGKKYQGIDCTKLYGLVSNDRFDPDRPEEITVDAEKYTDFLKAEVDLASSDLSKFIDKKEALSLQEAARRNKKDIDFRKEQYPYLKQFLDGKFGNSFGSVK